MSFLPSNDSFLRACRGESVPHTPIWLMRQAGRYMQEYRDLRAQHTILEMIKDPACAAEVTLQPVKAFDLDAAIIFADILTLPEAMGMKLEFIPGRGPVFHDPLRDPAAINDLHPCDPHADLGFTLDAIRESVKRLEGRIPLIGFSGAPFTLACYMIEGGGSKDFDRPRRWMHTYPNAWGSLMQRLAHAVTLYLQAQIDAGAHAVQLFDSWAGSLSESDYRRCVLPYTQQIFSALAESHPDVPRIHFCANGGHLLPVLAETPCTVLGVDWRVNPTRLRAQLGDDRVYQGNFDPVRLLTDRPTIEAGVREVLDGFRGTKGHIFNLGHGVIKTTDPENVRFLVDTVHRLSQRDDLA